MLRARASGDAIIAAIVVAGTPSVAACRVQQERPSTPSKPHKTYESWDEFARDVGNGRVRYLVCGVNGLHGALYPRSGEPSGTFEMAERLGETVPHAAWRAMYDAGVHVCHQVEVPNRWFWVAKNWLSPVVSLLLLAACIVRWRDAEGWAVAFFTGGIVAILLGLVLDRIATWGTASDPARINHSTQTVGKTGADP